MPSLFYAGQPDYIEKLNTLDTTATTQAGIATTQAGIATTQAGNATTQAAAAATSRAAIDNRIYPGAYASDPATRPDTTACQDGDQYFNSTLGLMMVHRSGVWISFEANAITAGALSASSAAAGVQAVAQSALDAAYRAGTIQPVDFTNSANYQRAIATITNPDTRYDVSVVANSLVTDLRQAAACIWGARLQNITQAGGRIYRIRGVFDASGTALTSNAGIMLGFDPGTGTGANVVLDAAAAGWAWRQNGSLTAYNCSTLSGTSDAAYAFTLTSGTVATFAAGDELMLELTANANNVGGTLRGYKNGVLAFTGTVLAIPAGKLCALARGVGGGGAYPSALRMTFSTLAMSDAVPSPTVTNVYAASIIAPSQIVATPGLSRAQPLSPVRDANAYLRRAVPSGFATWLPFRPMVVAGAGDVLMDSALIAALFNYYPALRSASLAYVETTGNNGTAVVGNAALPFLTIDGALQSAAKIIVVGDGVFDPPDYRFTQSAAGTMKLVMARNRGRTTIRQTGDTLSTNTWTLHSGNVWKTTIAAASGLATWGAKGPHLVRYTDTLDEFGFAARLPYFAPATQDNTGVTAAVAALDAAGTGWTYDGQTANKVLYVALGGADVQSNRSRLEALYYNASVDDRVFLSGGNLAFDGICFDGQLIWPLEYNSSGTYIPSSVWLSNCWLQFSPGYGVQVDSNTSAYLDNVRIHASALDGINADSTRSGSGAVAKVALAGCFISSSGDVDAYTTTQSQNRQAISSHSGYLAAFGCLFEKSWGQEVADTGSGAGPSKSWYVGCVARNGDTRLTSNVGFGFYDANRQAWLDTCVGLAEGTHPLYFTGGASGKVYNCTWDSAIVADGGSSAPTAYAPGSP